MRIKRLLSVLIAINILFFLSEFFVYAETAEVLKGKIPADLSAGLGKESNHAAVAGYLENKKGVHGFIIGFSNYGCKDKALLDGFGMWLNRLPHDVGSGEWYNKTDENTFKKLQGDGAVKVEYREREGHWEIAKIYFSNITKIGGV